MEYPLQVLPLNVSVPLMHILSPLMETTVFANKLTETTSNDMTKMKSFFIIMLVLVYFQYMSIITCFSAGNVTTNPSSVCSNLSDSSEPSIDTDLNSFM